MSTALLLLALVSPFLYAASNHIDNILLEKYFKEGGVGTLMLFSALLSVIALPILFWIDPTVMSVGGKEMFILALVSLLNLVLLWSYLQALFNDDPTVVIVYYQLVPVLGLGMGYFFLGETITPYQGLAMAVIISGASLLLFASNEQRLSFRLRTFFLMLIASLCWATESTIFKVVALEENPWRSLFWEHVAFVLFGVALFAFIKHYRKSFLLAIRLNSKQILGLNVFNESIYIIANSIAAYVVVLIPVALTLLMNSFQPLFVLIIGLLLTILFPRLEVEHVNKHNLGLKILAILITSVGVYILGGW